MIRVQPQPWATMVAHAQSTYPNECCGVMLGSIDDDNKVVEVAMNLENAYAGPQNEHYEVRPEDLLMADREARKLGMDVIGIFHSHPDCDAYFSKTDLENSCPWYSFIVLSIQKGTFHHANSWLPNEERTLAAQEPLEY